MVTLANIAVLIIVGALIRACVMSYKSFVLLDAIYEYRMYCLKHWEKPKVDSSDMVSFKDSIFNLAKWRYTDILPKEKFLLIQPFMK